MKHLHYYLIAFVFVSLVGSCDNLKENKQKKDGASSKDGVAVMTFEKINHDFGTVKEGEKVTYAFRFTNNGNADLKLTSVGTSCGCTASEYSTEPIKPGETGKIQISFDSAHRLGMQHKKITIRANTNPEFMVLNIYAQVVENNSETNLK